MRFLAALSLLLAALPSQAATISGFVRDLDGNGISNVQVTLSGSTAPISVTDVTGAYAFTGINTGISYTVIPSKSGQVYTPPNYSYAPLSGDQLGQNFAFGKVWSGGALDALASSPANWSAGIAPVAGDIIRFDGTNANKSCFWDLAVNLEGIQLEAAFSSSVVAGIDINVSTVQITGGDLLMKSFELKMLRNFIQSGAGHFRANSDGLISFEGGLLQTVTMNANSIGPGLYDSYFGHFRVATTSTVQLASPLIVDGICNIGSGHFQLAGATLTLTGGTQNGTSGSFNWDDSAGVFVSSPGWVVFDSRLGSTILIRESATNSFYHVVDAGSTQLVASTGIHVSGTLRITQTDGTPSLDLGNNLLHSFTGLVSVGPTADPSANALRIGTSTATFTAGISVGTASFSVNGGRVAIRGGALLGAGQGTLLVPSGQTGLFVFNNNTQLQLKQGTLKILGAATFISSTTVNTRFQTDLNGTVDIQGSALFDSMNANGFHLRESAVPLHLDNMTFRNGATGTAAFNFDPASIASVTINSPTFEATISTNVRAVIDPTIITQADITVVTGNGAHTGPAFEYDPSAIVNWGTLGTPTGFAGTPLGISSITWSWSIVNNPLNFVVISATGGAVSPTLTPNTTSWIEDSLGTNLSFTRAVRALTDSDQVDSSSATVYTYAESPSNGSFPAVVVTSVTFTWSAGGNPPSTIFTLEKSTDNAVYSPLASGTFGTLAPYIDTGLIPEKRYYYRVGAQNGEGRPALSTIVITTVTLPVPPPFVLSVDISSAPNLGSVRIKVGGSHFQNNALLRLRRSFSSTIEATSVVFVSQNEIDGTLHLTGAVGTAWDVEVENPDGKLSLGSGLGLFTVIDAPSVPPITTGNYFGATFALPTTNGDALLSVASGALPPSRFYISSDPQGTPLSIDPALIIAATAAQNYWILIPNTIREILAFTSAGSYTSGFNRPVTLGISFPDADHDGIIDSVTLRRSTLRMMTLNESNGQWEFLPGSTIDIHNNRVTAPLSHFSVYALFGSPAAADLSQARVYPSPWKPGSQGSFDARRLTFTNLTESGEIRVYSSAAKFMKSIFYNASEAGVAQWDGRDEAGTPLPSGVYIAVIKDIGGESVTMKFGVER